MSKITRFVTDLRGKNPSPPPGVENSIPVQQGFHLKALLRNFPLMLGGFIVLVLFLIVLFGPVFAPSNPYITGQTAGSYYDAEKEEWLSHPLSPSREHPMGTNQWGNDILSFLLYGARNTLVACAFVTMVRIILGVVLGAISGWNEGMLSDRLITGVISAISAVPLLISSMILVYALDIRRGLPVFIVALSALGWTEIAQYIRSEFLVLKRMPFIESARAVGAQEFAIAVRHVIPNILPQILILLFLEMGAVLMLLGELSFLGVFIGGGSQIALGDEIMGTRVRLAEVPEWGAMLAEGYRWLRAKPFMVAFPALAFFISVTGLNLFGEGLRRLLTSYRVSTNFLLKKRMILVVILMSLATVFIINNTGPAPWFEKIASDFDGRSAYALNEELADMDGRGVGQPGHETTAAFIQAKFEEYGFLPGWKQGKYIYPLTTEIVQLNEQPILEVLDEDGVLAHSFQHQIDFGFRIEGHGGSGDVSLPVTFVGFNASSVLDTWESYQGLDLRDQIVLLVEGNAPADFPTEALIRGARGVLWIAEENLGNIQSEIQLADPEKYYLSKPTLPIFKVSSTAAEVLLEEAGLSLGDLFTEELVDTQSGSGWYTFPLDVRVHMALSLSDPMSVEIPCVLGYQLGSDVGIGNQLIVVTVNYDSLGMDPDGTIYPGANHNASGVSTLLEVLHLWEEQEIDSRRSILLIAWGGGSLTDPGFTSFINNPFSIRHLPAQSNPRGLSPEAIIQFSGLGAGGDTLLLHPESSERLGAFLEEKALDIGVPVSRDQAVTLPNDFFSRQPGADWIYFTWERSAVPVEEDLFENIQEDKLANAGEILSYLLIKLGRQSHY
jgi:ABC-type dipeptide/oligopeptide/nickel transport system permease subunit